MTREDPVLAGLRTGRPLTGPRTVHIDITNACNAACVTCWDHSPLLDTPRPITWKRRRLEADRFFTLVDELAALGSLRAVVISGMGEPLVHPDVYDFIAAVKAQGWHLTIITNLIAADVDRLAQSSVDQLLVGVQGVTPASYTAFHPGWTEADFFRLCQYLRVLGEAGVRCRHVQVINRDLAWEVVEMVRFGQLFRADRVNYKLASLAEGTEACIASPLQLAWLAAEGIPRPAPSPPSSACPPTSTSSPARSTPPSAAPSHDPHRGGRLRHGLRLQPHHRRPGRLVLLQHRGPRRHPGRAARFADLWYGPAWQALRDRLAAGDYFEGCARCGKFEQNVKWAERLGAQRLEAERRRPSARRPSVPSQGRPPSSGRWLAPATTTAPTAFQSALPARPPRRRPGPRGHPDVRWPARHLGDQVQRRGFRPPALPRPHRARAGGPHPHRLSVLTNFSSSHRDLMRFAALTRGRLVVFSASLHLEFVTADDFAERPPGSSACSTRGGLRRQPGGPAAAKQACAAATPSKPAVCAGSLSSSRRAAA
ncbi:MAG: radical SAM protein [bacterium]